MKPIIFFLSIFLLVAAENSFSKNTFKGQQPQISQDINGIVRIVFGRNDSIFCSTSIDKGLSFSKEILVGVVHQMHLGMARGPQLASSAKISIVSVMDKTGNIHFFVLKNNKWTHGGIINDLRASAPEGLMNIAADKEDNFYAVWLDTRIGKTNNIFFSSLTSNSTKWKANSLVYQSPDKHVCECCRPSISVNGNEVAVMFRNWINGSRDLYLCKSLNKGTSFTSAEKLGTGTWKLNGCPMDGGGLVFTAKNSLLTTWRRQASIFYCKPGDSEIELGKGKNVAISEGNGKVIISYDDSGTVKFKDINSGKITTIGSGTYLKTLITNDHMICIWEDDNQIRITHI